MIRHATMNDVDACFNMAVEVYGDFMKGHGIPMIEKDLRKTVESFINSNQVLVVEHDNKVCGMAAWIVSGHPANQECKIWQEVLWCLKSKYKTDALLLIRAMENKALSVGANVMVLANLSEMNEPTLRRIYGKRGFSYMETHYSRRN